MHHNLKLLTDNGASQTKEHNPEKVKAKAKTDTGLPPQKEGEDKTARAGATFDPKMFKGNCMLFRHLNEASIAKCRKKIEISDAYKLKKNQRKLTTPKQEDLEDMFDVEPEPLPVLQRNITTGSQSFVEKKVEPVVKFPKHLELIN